MNVKLPNGQIINNVPDGTTKLQLAKKLNNSSVFTGEKIDVALLVEGKPGDPKSGLGSWTDKTGKEKFFTEIDDKEASIIDNDGTKFILDSNFRKQDKSSKKVGILSDIMKHDKLYKHTPELANVRIEVLPTIDPEGRYTNARAAFDYSVDGSLEKIIIHADRIKNKEDLLSVVLHEVQHKAHFDATVTDPLSEYSQKQGDYSKTETPIATEALAEVIQDRYYNQNNSVAENYLITSHLKRLGQKDPDNVRGQPISLSTIPYDNDDEQGARRRLDKFMEELAFIESRNKNVANSTGESSAKGYFQFLTDTSRGQSALQTAIKRTKKYFGNRKIDWMDKVYKTGDVMSLSYEQQKLLVIGDLMEKTLVVNGKKMPGEADKLWIKFFKAKTKDEETRIKREIYSKLHHTDVGGKNKESIERNMNTLWKLPGAKGVSF